MKAIKSLCLFLIIGCAAWGAPHQPDDPAVQLLSAENSLKNMATALEMYAVDHAGQYPSNLDALRVIYLKLIPTQPGGKAWNYTVGKDGKTFQLRTETEAFHPLGIPSGWPRYDSDSGFHLTPKDTRTIAGLPTAPVIAVHGDWGERGNPRSRYWKKDDQEFSSRLFAPLGYTTPERYVYSSVEGRVKREGALAQAFKLPNGLRGWDLRYSAEGSRAHVIFVYDRGLVWELSYAAPTDSYSEAHDELLQAAVEKISAAP